MVGIGALYIGYEARKSELEFGRDKLSDVDSKMPWGG